jgi:hypothetical protein
MRFKSRGVLVALAVLTMSVIAVSAASAATLPEFKPVPTKHKFKATSGTVELGWGTRELKCPQGTVTGELTGARTVGNVVMSFTGCETTTTKGTTWCPVNSYGAKAGEIVTEPLDGELGTVATKEAPSGVGLLVKPENVEDGWSEVQGNECTPAMFPEGDVIAELSAIGKKQTTNKLVFKPGTDDIKLDSGISKVAKLNVFGVKASFANTTEVTFEEALEVT